MSDASDTFRFLSILLGPHCNSDESLRCELRCLCPRTAQVARRRWYPLTPEALNAAANDAHEWARCFHVYAGVLPRATHGGGKAEHVQTAAWLWADVEGARRMGDPEACLDGAVQVVRVACRQGGLPLPHLCVVSGRGLHLYWRLAEIVPLPTPADKDRFKTTLRRLAHLLKGSGEERAAGADSGATDVARVLRVPGTWNHKAEPPLPVYLWGDHATSEPGFEARPLDWWQAFLPALPLPPPRKEKRRHRAGDDEQSSAALSPDAQRLLTTPTPHGRRHPTALFLMCEVFAAGFSREAAEIIADTFATLNHFPQDEMNAIVDWAETKAR